MSLLFIYFFVVLVSFSFMSPKMNPWSKRKGNSVRCFNSQDSLALCQGEVSLGLGNNLVLRESSFSFFDKSYRTSNTEWVVSKELRSTFSSRNLWLRREARWVFFPKGPLLFSSNTGSFTLHSDQSFPGTPSQLCSRTGIDPGNKEEKT